MKKKVKYYPREDVLYFNRGKKARDSLKVGPLVIDFYGKNVVGLEVLNASKALKDVLGEKVSKEGLKKIKDIKVSVSRKGNAVFVRILLFFKRKFPLPEKKRKVSISLPAKVQAAG